MLGSDLLLGDSRGYDAWARQIAAGDWLGTEVFYQTPLYPYSLAAVYSLFGHSIVAVRIIQAILGAVSCLLLAGAGRRFFGAQVGTVAGVLLAAYPLAIFFVGRIDKASLDLFLMCLALAVCGRAVSASRPRVWLLTGLVLGILCLNRENAQVLSISVLIWLSWNALVKKTQSRLSPVLFVLGTALILVPVAMRNWSVGGGFHLTTSQLGPNFYIGNNPVSNGTYMPLRYGRGTSLDERQDATELAEAARGRPLSPSEVSSYWLGRSLDYIRAHPVDWVERKWKTFILLCNATEVSDSEDIYTHYAWSPSVRVLGPCLHMGTLFPLACLGVCVTWSTRGRCSLLFVIAVSYAASVVLFYVFDRYRLPLAPIVILFASAALARGGDTIAWLRRASWSRRLWTVSAALAVVALCNWPTISTRSLRAVTYLNMGIARLELDDTPRAIELLYTAVESDPEYALAHYTLANTLKTADRVDEAITHYRAAVRFKPDFAEAHNNWGTALASRGHVHAASDRFKRAVAADPTFVAAYFNLGNALRSSNRRDEAIAAYRRAITLAPRYAEALHNLGITLYEQGRIDEARDQFVTVVELRPDSARAHRWLADIYLVQGLADKAEEHSRKARRHESTFNSGPGALSERRWPVGPDRR